MIETTEQRKARHARYVQKWRQNNPEKQSLARKRAYDNRKVKAFSLLGEVRCRRCGCDELHFLEFNHKKGDGCKEWRETGGKAMMDLILTRKRRIDDLEILCRVCNALDFLERKNKIAAKRFNVHWKKLTDQKAEKI